MDLYPELFFSKWTLIALAFTLLAFIGLIIGKYSKQQVIQTTIKVAIFSYLIVQIPVGIITYQMNFYERDMVEELDRVHEEKGDDHVLFVKYYVSSDEGEDEKDKKVKVYVKNYSENDFKGKVQLIIEDDKEEVIKEYTYDIAMDAGGHQELDAFKTDEKLGMFYYQFIED